MSRGQRFVDKAEVASVYHLDARSTEDQDHPSRSNG